MTIEEVRRQLIDGLEDEFTPARISIVDRRLKEIAEENNLSLEELNECCWADSSEMFDCIFNGKEFDADNFYVDDFGLFVNEVEGRVS